MNEREYCDEFAEFNDIIEEWNRKSRAEQATEDFYHSELIVSQNCRYPLNDISSKLNNNVLVVGGSGTGKTRTILTPNIHEAVGSYVISDPKGNLYKKFGKYLEEKGYVIRIVDFTHPERSAHFNPMLGAKKHRDILKLAELIVDKKASAGTKADPFWDDSNILLISALIAYMIETDMPMNFKTFLKLFREGARGDDDDRFDTQLYKRFQALKRRDPDSWACAQYENAMMGSGKTYDSIMVTLASKFAYFDTKELQDMMRGNDFELASIGQEKTAVFVVVSDTDRSMDSLANIFFTQAMNALCEYADEECEDNRLPVPVRFMLDDFATNCHIEEFPRMISSIRSRAISVMLMVQSESQLFQGYKEDGYTIISNCDTYIYLGGNDLKTASTISERCNISMGKILYMPVGDCWIFRRGSQPVHDTVLNPAEYIRDMERG